MDALKFIEERNRMCERYWQVDGDCDGCPMVNVAECNELRNMVDGAGKTVGKVVEIVEKWSKKHPRKTRQDVFLGQWPEAEIDEDGILLLCPKFISADYRNRDKKWKLGDNSADCENIGCTNCRMEFWGQEG